MHKAFINSYRYLKNHKIIGLILLGVYLLIMLFFVSKLQLSSDISSLVPASDEKAELKKVLETAGLSNTLMVSISAKDKTVSPDSLVVYANQLTGQLESDFGNYIYDIKGRIPQEDLRQIYGFVYENLPVFLDKQDYEQLSERLYPDSIRKRLASGYRQLMTPTGFVTKDYFLKDPLSITNLGLSKLQELQVSENFSLYNNYLITNDRQHILLFISTAYSVSDSDKNEKFLEGVEQVVTKLNSEFSSVQADYFGEMMYNLASSQQIGRDIWFSLLVATGIILILLVFLFRNIFIPLILFLPIVMAAFSALAILAVLKENVPFLSFGIGALVLGICLDYPLHIILQYRKTLHIQKLYGEIVKPSMLSSLSIAVVFLCLTFLKIEALSILGLFVALSVLLSSILSLILVPWLIDFKIQGPDQSFFLDRFSIKDYSRLRTLVYLILGISAISIFLFNNVEFEKDFSEVNYQPEELKKTERKVEGLAGRLGKTIYMVAYGNRIDDALQENSDLYDRLKLMKEEGEIRNFSSIGGVILSTLTQNERIEAWETFWNEARRDSLRSNLVEISGEYGFKTESFDRFYSLLDQDFENLDLDDYKEAGSFYLSDFISEGAQVSTVNSAVSLPRDNVEDFLSVFEGREGILAIDNKAINKLFLKGLKNDFNEVLLLTLVIVFILMLIFYRSLEISLFTIFPVIVTWLCTFGMLVPLQIQLNVFNMVFSTFVLAFSLAYSIFMTRACLMEYEYGTKGLKFYGNSILLAGITNMFAIGALFFAGHSALNSIPLPSLIGAFFALAVSFVLQRGIFRKLVLDRVEIGEPPYFFKQVLRVNTRKQPSESEKLYRKGAVLSNYRYKSVFEDVRKKFRACREKMLRLSRYINENEQVSIINSEYGILPLFLSYKFDTIDIQVLERVDESRQIAKNTPQSRKKNIRYYANLDELPPTGVYIIHGNYEDSEALINFIKPHVQKFILVDSDFPHRWLLDMNFEIVYRQNNILVLQKAE
ncbi:hypothetical protein E0K83_07880 [Gramella sp. BOM4]|nr:hypothetical protein [Christiangramia bathymodioli]